MQSIAVIISFLIVLLVIPSWIKRAKKFGFLEKDVHKKDVEVAGLGGLMVVFGFIVSLLFLIAYYVFYLKADGQVLILFAILGSILIATIIGLVDDLLGWKIGLRKYQKILLALLIALPIMAINAGVSEITLPFIGPINIFLLYPLLAVPIGISGGANGFNILAGYNGLEAGMGIIILATQGIIVFALGNVMISIIAFSMATALLAFLIYNKYPAKIFPGDTLTYSVGALIVIVAIVGNIEKFSLVLFAPYLIEGVLKLRGKLQKESFARLLPDGSLTEPYKKYYGIEHIAITIIKKIKGKCYEQNVVHLLWLFQAIIAGLVILTFFY